MTNTKTLQRLRPGTFTRDGRELQMQPQQQQQGGGGKGGGAPAPAPPEPPPPPPVIEDTAGKQQDETDAILRRKGAQSTIATSPLGITTPPATQAATLLGG